MSQLLLPATVACLLSAFAVALLKSRSWVDRAGDDPLKIHQGEMPVLGGLGMAIAFFVGSIWGSIWAFRLSALPTGFLALIGVAALGAWALGLRDDLRGLPPLFRLAIELLLGMIVGGGFWALGAGPLVAALAVLYIVGAINALNMQDGLDGLAGTLTLISCAGFAVAALYRGSPPAALLAAVLAGAVLGFLFHNLPRASIFMGDNGAYFLGLLLGVQGLLVLAQRPTLRGLAASVLLIGLPVLDAALAILRRLRRGVSPFRGDRDHLYDLLSKRGLSTWGVLGICGLIQAGLVTLGLALLTIP
jgi:UDP-GlcNAc:undecaprenyl-phosphate GlcNAc-1-phosphate transferase